MRNVNFTMVARIAAAWILVLNATLEAKDGQTEKQPSAIRINSRRELFVDDYLIDDMKGDVALRLHRPEPKEVVMTFDAPWEGTGSGYVTVLKDADRYRMYYKAWDLDVDTKPGTLKGGHPLYVAMAESGDGLNWTRPTLGIFEFDGSKDNNIVWPEAPGCHGFTPFIDQNPDCGPEGRYKAVGGKRRAVGNGLFALQSPDGVHWSLMSNEPVIEEGNYDSQNVAFWDSIRGEYRMYGRGEGRSIITATSKDFMHWSEPVRLRYPGWRRQPHRNQMYTNQIQPCPGAPHLLVGFPTRYQDREWTPSARALPELERRRIRSEASPRFGTAVTDGMFMTSRDRIDFHRWDEAFLPPGPERPGQWVYGACFQAYGIVKTPSQLSGAPDEWSVYATEGYWHGEGSSLRRYTLRQEGFVSLHSPLGDGEAPVLDERNRPLCAGVVLTKPIVFNGDELVLNVATSAAGGVRVGFRDEQGRPIEGYGLRECDVVYGDALNRIVTWNGESDVSGLSGVPVRLRIGLKDADLYALRFQ